MKYGKLSRRGLAGTLAGGAASAFAQAPIKPNDPLKITKLETFLVKPRWLFLKIHTNARHRRPRRTHHRRPRADLRRQPSRKSSLTSSARTRAPWSHHWQAIYRHAFYRGGPILTSALSGIDQALWDIKGKALGVPGLRTARRAHAGPRPRLRPCRHS